MNEMQTYLDRGWVYRVRPPAERENTAPGLALLLHGWTGNETVMWIFARGLEPNRWAIAPRGPVPGHPGGYGWSPVGQGVIQHFRTYAAAAGELMAQVALWRRSLRIPDGPMDVTGFSQGAAMAYALLIEYPDQVGKTAALAGFIPDGGIERLGQQVAGKAVLIAHGTQDSTVPVRRARAAAIALQNVGARVEYCEDPVGHKLGASCSKRLAEFLAGE